MTSCSSGTWQTAGMAFDSIAEQYDDIFTRSLIGRAQRDTVWDVLRTIFRPGDRVLELNCGTGEDAMFLATLGVSVVACDASERMINVATRRTQSVPQGAEIQFEACPTEHIADLRDRGPFDGALSNFSGLNCVPDLLGTAQRLATLIRPGGSLVLVLSSRFCLWESVWYLAQGKPIRAGRRWKGKVTASLGSIDLEVRYPTVWGISRLFRPFFVLRARRGVGVAIPPSYVEGLARKYPEALRKLQAFDRKVASWPVCRSIGDHTLLVLERTPA